MDDNENLLAKISALEKRINGLYNHLKKAYTFSSTQPQIALNQCRMILETILYDLYVQEMHKDINKPMIGTMLNDKEFEKKIPRRILAKIKYITDLGNLGSHFSNHGEEVESQDAFIIMRELINVLEWFLSNYHLLGRSNEIKTRQALEILPKLKEKYPKYLIPDVISVEFIQSRESCILEITSKEIVPFKTFGPEQSPLYTNVINREDLEFIVDDIDENMVPILTFKPERNIFENVEKFLSDEFTDTIFNVLSLFSDEATKKYFAKKKGKK
jgi:hypothetical protein